MIETRIVTLEEETEFLRILCDVFELDFSRASTIFFSEPLHDIRQNWGLFQNGRLQSILTMTPLRFGFGPAQGISGVATLPEFRHQGNGHTLLRASMEANEAQGCSVFMLFAHRLDLYAEMGFAHLDDVIRAPLVTTRYEVLEFASTVRVKDHYDRWANARPDRLIRDETRWDFWKWTPRCCEEFAGGYLCSEASLVREAVVPEPALAWPVPPGAEWLGLRSVTEAENVPIGPSRHDLYYMVRGIDTPPQMFMTDQF